MEIKKILRKLLNEKKHTSHKNEYGCVMVYLKKSTIWDDLLDKIDEEDLYLPEDDPTYGKEDEPHVTILYGLHNDIKDSEIENKIDDIDNISLELNKISAFKNDKFDVLKFDVISKDLVKYNKEFAKLPHTTKYPDYHPHATIAYLKPTLADKYIKKLADVSIELEPDSIVYSKANGSKKKYQF